MAKEYCLFTFASTHAALRSEKVLHGEGVPFLLIPIPREISAGCGLALRVGCERVQTVKGLLAESGITPQGVFRRREEGETSLLEKFLGEGVRCRNSGDEGKDIQVSGRNIGRRGKNS